MHIKIKRIHLGESFTIGKLFIDDKDLNIYTLEDKVREVEGEPVIKWKIQNKTAIPKGIYKVIINLSNRFKRLLPLLLNVEGFEGVRIHKGNNSENTEGCILLGKTWDGSSDWIGSSNIAFEEFFIKIQNSDNLTISIE